MRRAIPVLLVAVLAGCPSPSDDEPIDSDSPVPTDTEDAPDSLPFETAWPTLTDTDVAIPTDVDTDTGGLADTQIGFCIFGETLDCNSDCYPEYFIGDGFCDDGSLSADFDCVSFNYDDGDCASHSDTDQAACDSRYIIRFQTAAWAGEIFWHIENLAGRTMASVTPGQYANGTLYEHPVFLPPGGYVFVGEDTWGDGWHGAVWSVIDAASGALVFESDPGDFYAGVGSRGTDRYEWRFDVGCTPTISCEMDIVTLGGSSAPEAGWELYTSLGILMAERTAGTVAADTVITDTVTLFQGGHELRLRDAASNGWQDTRVEVRHTSGLLATATSLANGDSETWDFEVDCRGAGDPAYDAPGPPIQVRDCSRLDYEMTTQSGGRDVGYRVFYAPTWATFESHRPGDFNDNSVRVHQEGTIPGGLYFLHTEDRVGDGWNGGRWRLLDRDTGEVYVQVQQPGGYSSGKYFEIVCPIPVDTDTDTDIPGPTDTDIEPQGCLPGSIEDCGGVCWNQIYWQDGVCDDGGQFAPDFACEALNFDGGDCPRP